MTPTLPFAIMNVFFIFMVPLESPFVTEVTEDGSTNFKVLVAEFIEILIILMDIIGKIEIMEKKIIFA